MLKHAFLITAHAHFILLEKTIKLLSAPNHYFFINIDKKTREDKFISECKRSYTNIYFTEGKDRMEVSHGGYTQVECCMRLLKMASEQGMDYFHFISGQDFPCKSNIEFDLFFEQNLGYSYMQLDSENLHKEKSRTDYLNRTLPFWFIDVPHRDLKIVNFIVKILNYVSSRISWRKEIPNLRGGWNWFSWYKSVTDYVLDYSKTYPEFFKRFRHTRCSDELVFATMLYPHIRKLKIEANNSLRYVNWQKRVLGRSFRSAPLILNEEEYEEIIQSGAFFCRKVHPKISARLLVLLEQNINKKT